MQKSSYKPVYVLDGKAEYMDTCKNVEEAAEKLEIKLNTAKMAIRRGNCLQGKYFLSHRYPVKLRIEVAKKRLAAS